MLFVYCFHGDGDNDRFFCIMTWHAEMSLPYFHLGSHQEIFGITNADKRQAGFEPE